MTPSGATDGLRPGGVVRGPVPVPGSKSLAQRALAAAAWAHGVTELVGLPSSEDVVHALRCARAAGARFPTEERPDDLFVTALLRRRGHGRLAGVPPRGDLRPRPWCVAPVGESGTAARIFTALLALARPEGSGSEVEPTGSLARRRSPALFRALRAAGAGVEHGQGAADGWPVLLTAAPPGERVELAYPGSSQEVSALLLALAAHDGARRLDVQGAVPSRPYVDLTLAVLRAFGVAVEIEAMPWGERFAVQGPLRAPAEPFRVEPDASAAAVALAAGCLSGGQVRVAELGPDSVQPDALALDRLAAFGCAVEHTADGPVASGRPSRGADVDCADAPDLAPVLAAVAADVALRGVGASRLSGLGTLPGKESSRIAVLAEGLRALGLDVEHDDASLSIAPGRPHEDPVELDPRGDHRMAFAFALVGLVRDGVRVRDPRCVSKSWPGFWGDLSRCGAGRAPRS